MRFVGTIEISKVCWTQCTAKRDLSLPEYFIIWTTEIIDHLADNAVSQDDFEYVVLGASVSQEERSRSSENTCCFGYAEDGRHLCCVYEKVDETTIVPVTAFEVDNDR